MVGQRLTNYLQSCGLEAEDVPKVAAIFLGAKYCAWATSVGLAVRYRPLRRFFLSRREALFGSSFVGGRPFSERKRLWLVEALDMAKRRSEKPAEMARALRARGTAAALLKKLRSRRQAIAASFAGAKDRYHAANYSWKLAGWQLLRKQERQKLGMLPAKHREPISWYSWTSARYWQLSDKLEASADSSRVWGTLTRQLNLNSKGLALGLAEGTILFKFTVPVHMPLMLLTIVSFFRHRRWVAAETQTLEETAEETKAANGAVAEVLEEARSTLSFTSEAAKDTNALVGWGWAFWQLVE
mmetsp:Transcript_56593/g.106184  ORF Transcript_56593/g.106184 Transcript_56593/m.106184 type:complete len:299 (-) Transcript_56593:270-1166(-)